MKESQPEGKRVKFNLGETRCVGDDNNPPLAVGEDNMGNASATAGQDGDVITPHCDTVTGIQFPWLPTPLINIYYAGVKVHVHVLSMCVKL